MTKMNKKEKIIFKIDCILNLAEELIKFKVDLHDQPDKDIREAMKDLTSNDYVSILLTGKSAKEWAENRRTIHLAMEGLHKGTIKIKNNE